MIKNESLSRMKLRSVRMKEKRGKTATRRSGSHLFFIFIHLFLFFELFAVPLFFNHIVRKIYSTLEWRGSEVEVNFEDIY